jgi:hypothetical protein
MELLKNQLASFTKGNWVKSFATKIFTWSNRNPKTVLALGGVALELLPADIKEHLPKDILQLGDSVESETISE